MRLRLNLSKFKFNTYRNLKLRNIYINSEIWEGDYYVRLLREMSIFFNNTAVENICTIYKIMSHYSDYY